jgi:hypothetical protein
MPGSFCLFVCVKYSFHAHNSFKSLRISYRLLNNSLASQKQLKGRVAGPKIQIIYLYNIRHFSPQGLKIVKKFFVTGKNRPSLDKVS